MNKKIFIMSFVALFMALGMSQSVMAKETEVINHGCNDMAISQDGNGISQTDESERQKIWKQHKSIMLPNRILIMPYQAGLSKEDLEELAPKYRLVVDNRDLSWVADCDDYVYGKKDKLAFYSIKRISIFYEKSWYYYRSDRIYKLVKDSILPFITIAPNTEVEIYGSNKESENNDVGTKVAVYKNGVLMTIAQEEAAEAAKQRANYNALCKKYGKKYVDAGSDGRIIIGMPEGLVKEFFYYKLTYQSAQSKKYRIYTSGGKWVKTVWIQNGRVSSISTH